MKLPVKMLLISIVASAIVGITLLIMNYVSTHRVLGPADSLEFQQLTFTHLAQLETMVTSPANSKHNICKLSDEELKLLTVNFRAALHARWDKEVAAFEDIKFFPKDCASHCSCGIYMGFFDYSEANGILVGPEFTAMHDSYKEQSSKQNIESCQASADWICKSVVLKTLLASPPKAPDTSDIRD